jgi:hypothetical protein
MDHMQEAQLQEDALPEEERAPLLPAAQILPSTSATLVTTYTLVRTGFHIFSLWQRGIHPQLPPSLVSDTFSTLMTYAAIPGILLPENAQKTMRQIEKMEAQTAQLKDAQIALAPQLLGDQEEDLERGGQQTKDPLEYYNPQFFRSSPKCAVNSFSPK